MNRALIHIRPMPSPRPRVMGKTTFMPATYQAHKRVIAAECKNFEKFDGAVTIELAFCYKIPKSWTKARKLAYQKEIPNGDCDNLAKTVLDALEGVAFYNDNQVCSLTVRKGYFEYDAIEIVVKYGHGYK